MYIQSNFNNGQQESYRKEKNSITPWLVGGGVLAGGLGLAMASKALTKPRLAKEIKEELVKKNVDNTKKFIATKSKSDKVSGYLGLSKKDRAIKLGNRNSLLDQVRDGNQKSTLEKAKQLAKQRGTEYMKYQITADFALAGTLPTNTGVLNKITGKLGKTVDKAKNWLQKTQQAKKEVGSASIAKQRLKSTSPNAAAEAIAKRKYGQQSKINQEAIQKAQQKKQASDALRQSTANQNYKYAQNLENKGISPLWNKPTPNRYGQVQSNKVADSLANQQFLRLRYTKDPRTGRLVAAAYNKQLSLLCDL